MVKKRHLVIVALATFCLTASLFMIVSSRSQSQSQYDPWVDLNDDGQINILESIIVANHFLESGTPVNKTELLYNVSDTFARLLSRIDIMNGSMSKLEHDLDELNATDLMMINDLKASLNELQSDVTNMNNTLESEISSLMTSVNELQNSNVALNSSLISLNTTVTSLSDQMTILLSKVNSMNGTLVPLWDSEWIGPTTAGIDTVIYFGNTLDITDSVVYMIGKKTSDGAPHQIDYGGIWTDSTDPWHGIYWWNLTPNSITIHRHGNDSNWVYVRITIWKKVILSG
jgi:uncharacterized protein YqgV (UPF0045/DUF77 family)